MAKEPLDIAHARDVLRKRGVGLRHTKNGWWLLLGKGGDGTPLGPWTDKFLLDYVRQMEDEGW